MQFHAKATHYHEGYPMPPSGERGGRGAGPAVSTSSARIARGKNFFFFHLVDNSAPAVVERPRARGDDAEILDERRRAAGTGGVRLRRVLIPSASSTKGLGPRARHHRRLRCGRMWEPGGGNGQVIRVLVLGGASSSRPRVRGKTDVEGQPRRLRRV